MKSKKTIVHICKDEKFIDAAYEIYEKAFPGCNNFLVLLDNEHEVVKHLSDNYEYNFINTNKNYVQNVKYYLATAKIVVFHSLNDKMAKISYAIRGMELKKIWSVFGFEVYNHPYLFGKELYGRKTYYQFVFSFEERLKKYFRPVYYKLFNRSIDRYKLPLLAMKQMDFIATLFQEEFIFYKDLGILNEEANFLPFTYYPLDIIINKDAEWVVSNDILLGNSASCTNNHLEAFSYLNRLNISDQRITVPLSYGDENYAKVIAEQGAKIFGDNFNPLRKFYPLKEYQKIIQNCGIVVMNHYRQQAVGNILNTLYVGAKVYLSKKSTLYDYLKRIGCIVYSVEKDLKPSNKNVFSLLSKGQMEHNRKILKKELSMEKICGELEANLSPIMK